ncbi:hypothetical protein B0T21DRAFT_411068 [Apiosordaria backusii]|uniref:PH domain-containing protein n=1 Tax=Apiosordaria backusii TaxID=314023 RepID=A0AA40EH58_9PEZI|nr:hypothetical protein B0T21DRAFT_411068 [Apiosordaria backusii]
MARQGRVRSFIAQFTAPRRDSRTPTPAPASPPKSTESSFQSSPILSKPDSSPDTSVTSPSSSPPLQSSPTLQGSPTLQDSSESELPSDSTADTTPATSPEDEHAPVVAVLTSPPSRSPHPRAKRSERPRSISQTYRPLIMELSNQTPAEFLPIFSLLNSHSNKLYQEGYFLKLDDQDIKGKPNPDRTWTECFAQLVGTVLSLWDAAELDAAGDDGEVLPKFINLTDASIKMIESLPTRSTDEQPLQNILSISTAGRNRYLLHFNSHHSLIQWTSGIRLAMYEHSTLQEAYTGAVVAGKGKTLNSINIIMERARVPVQEYVRVRFGAGVPWRRCWCVIEPPSEKEYQKAQKEHKKRSAYDRSHAPVLKGEIRFFDTKKEAEKKKKHQKPIATITDAYAAYAIYPQAKALIDGSTLLKIEGDIHIHTDPPSSTEGFVFIMPESHPMVPGFETLLRFLFPTWDTFGLYGRPGRLCASTRDSRSLMFAMPKHKKYGYLELLDVSGLITTEGSSSWSEREWRKKLKELTGTRMLDMEANGDTASHSSKRLSQGGQSRPRVGFASDDGSSGRSSRSMSVTRPGTRTDSAPPDANRERAPSAMAGHARHTRNSSDPQLDHNPPYPYDLDNHAVGPSAIRPADRARTFASDLASTPERVSSEDESSRAMAGYNLNEMQRMMTPEPVNLPPAFAHGAGSRPYPKPQPSPELRREHNRLSDTTLSQLANARGMGPDRFPDEHLRGDNMMGPHSGYNDPRGQPVQTQTTSAVTMESNANYNGSREVLTAPTTYQAAPGSLPPRLDSLQNRSDSPLRSPALSPVSNVVSALSSGPPTGPSPNGSAMHPTMSPPGQHPDGQIHPQSQGNQPAQSSSGFPSGRRTPPPSSRSDLPFNFTERSPIHRKPLPVRSTSLQYNPQEAVSPVSYYSPQNRSESHFNDGASTASPDYASTRRASIELPERSAERPRIGVLKSTGEETPPPDVKVGEGYKIPDIDFGRTLNYGALPPGKILSATGSAHGTDSGSGTESPRQVSSPSGRKSPGPGPAYSHLRQESNDSVRRSVAWQPGAVPGSTISNDRSISPEQFVQQRATMHQRNPSGYSLNEFRTGTPTSPYKRPGSNLASHSRSNSADLLSSGRPVSQGGMLALSSGEVSSHLSAREQEHVARMTGSPLIAIAGNKGSPQPKAGLVGAIEAREREKAQMRQGIGGQAVAQAIDQRHREQHQQAQRAAQAAFAQQQAHFAAQYQGFMGPSSTSTPSSQSSPRAQFPLQYGPQSWSPQVASQHSSLSGTPPVNQGFVPGGGWGLPNMQQHGQIGLGMSNSPPPQGQFASPVIPGAPRSGTSGRMAFQGQAF